MLLNLTITYLFLVIVALSFNVTLNLARVTVSHNFRLYVTQCAFISSNSDFMSYFKYNYLLCFTLKQKQVSM